MKRRFLAVASSILITGCSANFHLVEISDDAFLDTDNDLTWHFETVPALPRTPVEEAAVECANSLQTVKSIGISAYYFGKDGDWDMVVTVEQTSADGERFEPKKVTRYRIIPEGIVAVCGPANEPFPDPEFERAVMVAARRAVGGSSVVPYDDGINKVTLRGTGLGKCSSRVQVIDGYDSAGEVIFEKAINFCRK